MIQQKEGLLVVKIITLVIPYCVPGTVVNTSHAPSHSVFTRTLCMKEIPGLSWFSGTEISLESLTCSKGALLGNLGTNGNGSWTQYYGKGCSKSSGLVVSILFTYFTVKILFSNSIKLKFSI